jgi:hypothetical protein
MEKLYYFVGASLPKIGKISNKLERSFEDLMFLYNMNLSDKDLLCLKSFRTYVDIMNLKYHWQHQKNVFDPRGNLQGKEFDENLLIETDLPQYVFDFIEKYDTDETRLSHFPKLLTKFFNDKIEDEEGFLKKYFSFEKQIKIIILALRAKTFKKDILFELRFEDLKNPLVAGLIAQKDQEKIIVPKKFSKLENIYYDNIENPYLLCKNLIIYKLDFFSEIIEQKPFSIDFLLGYLAIFMLIEDWQNLDQKEAKGIIHTHL